MANCPPQTHVCSLLLQAHIEQWPFLSGQGSQDTFLENTPWSKMDPLAIDLLKARTFELIMTRRASVCTASHWALNSWPKTLSLALTNFRSEIFHVSYASCTNKFAPVQSLRFSELILGILLLEFRFTVFFPLGCGVDS